MTIRSYKSIAQTIAAAIMLLGTIVLPGDAAVNDRMDEAIDVFFCEFGEEWDQNFDNWPDGWQRRRDQTYPSYVKIALEPDDSASAGRCLVTHLDGGSAYIASPPVNVQQRFSYSLSARVRVEDIEFAHVTVAILWQNDQGQQVAETVTPPILSDKGRWQEIRIGPVSPTGRDATRAVVVLEAKRGGRIDRLGRIALDDVRLIRLPQMKLTTNRPQGIYLDVDNIEIDCTISGIPVADPSLRFEMYNVEGELLDTKPAKLNGTEVARNVNSSVGGQEGQRGVDYQGSVQYRPAVPGIGFYRIRAILLTDGQERKTRETAIAVLRPLPRPVEGPFGWTLPSMDYPVSRNDWLPLFSEMGVHWAKIPVWYDVQQASRGDDIVQFTEQLGTAGIDVVGVIDRPPPTTESTSRLATASTIADIFSLDPSHWLGPLEPITTRLSLRVRWWQLGSDDDTSLVGYPKLPDFLAGIQEQLFRFGQTVRLGVTWNWNAQPTWNQPATWDYLQWTADPGLTSQELAAQLDGAKEDQTIDWVLIQPIARSDYALNVRVADLVAQMMVAQIHQADAAFVPKPFDRQQGLLDENGMPGELLLVFRTTANLLASAKYVGEITMPSGSRNRVFQRVDGELVMVVWNSKPTTETLFLGEDLVHIDAWGRDREFSEDKNSQSIRVDQTPTFLIGLNVPVTLLRISTEFERRRIPSIFGRSHANALLFRSPFSQGVGGHVTIVGPNTWSIEPQRIEFKAATNAAVRRVFEITPLYNASSGRQQVRLDFDIEARRRYRFSVYRHLEVGLGDIEINISTRLADDGTLVVEQFTVNHSDQAVSLQCILYAPSRRRQRKHVFQLSSGQDIQTFHLPNGAELIGKRLRLRAEEINGPRVLNYEFEVAY